MGVTVQFNSADKTFNRIFTQPKRLQIVKETEMLMAPFVPRKRGDLMDTTLVTADSITYLMRYAGRQYRGKDFNFSKEQNPLATAYWDKAMMASKSAELSRRAERIAKK